MIMEKKIKALSKEDLEKISGGSGKEYQEYTQYLFAKYGVSRIRDLERKVTKEEIDYAWYLLLRSPNEPQRLDPDQYQ